MCGVLFRNIYLLIQEVIQQDTAEPIEEDMVENKPQEVEEIVEDDDEARSEATFR